MKSNIFIPEKINVGFQNRNDTYTKKLAYVIYYDQKGILRKEKSWQSWRNEKIPNQIFENVPTSGFVLNKKAGGYDTGWNHRQTYCRIYDPRDFEFEITIPNLLYILENTSCIKGKGLDGEFVYGWDGSDLILIPVNSPDYKELKDLNTLRYEKKKFNGKDLILGATYKSNNNNDLIYLGRYYESNGENKESKTYFFYKRNAKYYNIVNFKTLTGNILDIVDDKCVEDYADLLDELFKSSSYSDRDPKKDKYVPYTLEGFKEKFSNVYYHDCFYNDKGEKYFISRYNRWHYSYTNYEYKYDISDNKRNRPNEKIDREISIERVFEKYKPHYLITYNSKGELIKEWKKK